jgi:hypothetical protein
MSESRTHERKTIPEQTMLIRLAQSEQMRNFFIQMWIQNPALAAQGGEKVRSLLSRLQPIAAIVDEQKPAMCIDLSRSNSCRV